MSSEYAGQDLNVLAKQAERDLNSGAANSHASDSTRESGVDQSVEREFPGAEVTYGSAASGAGDNREIPVSEGGGVNSVTGKPTKARDFEGLGGPVDKARAYAEEHGGENDVRGNVRQGGETVRPAGSMASEAVGGVGKMTGEQSG